MPALVVVGAQWGDEGKGKIVHCLAEEADCVVRYQGGNNAGHTVVSGGKTFALHLIPSGILVPRAHNVIGNGLVLSPQAFMEEVSALKKRGIRMEGRLHVSLMAHVILPYHIMLDILREDGGRGLGTTRRGIGPCYEDKVARIGVRVCDYLEPETFKALVDQNLRIRAAELSRMKPLAAIREEVFADYARLRRFLAPFCQDTSVFLSQLLTKGRRLLMESAQGAMLDLDFGTYPFVTSSNPVSGGAAVGAGVAPSVLRSVLGVTKAYTTRVGLGPFPTEMEGRMASRLREIGHEYGTTTGRPRRIGWLDLVQLRTAARVSGIKTIAMTKLDTLSGTDLIKVCVAYRYKGKRVDEFPASRRAQMECEPIYENIPGFTGDIQSVRRFADLPVRARRYVLEVEKRLKLPVAVVSVGPSREETIYRKPLGKQYWAA